MPDIHKIPGGSSNGNQNDWVLGTGNVQASTGGGFIYKPAEPTTTTTQTDTWYSGNVNDRTLSNYNKYQAGYQQSDSVTDAYNKLQHVLNNKPGEFSSQYTAQLNNVYNQIINREAFSYDQNSDVLYGLYKDQYTNAGKYAMNDKMGQMAAATGGYNNSAAQANGYQLYSQYLNEINNKALELHQSAYNRYQDEGDMLNSKFNVTKDMYNTDYTQYRDKVSDWQSDRDYYYNYYSGERNFDYNMFSSDRDYWTSEYWNQLKSKTTTKTVTTTR